MFHVTTDRNMGLLRKTNKQESKSITPYSIECTKVQVVYTALINKCFNEVMSRKGQNELFTLTDAESITTALLATVNADLGEIPPQFKAACDLSLAIIAPSALEKKKYIKSAVGVAGGVTGIGMILGALGAVLGWGAGVIAAVQAFFVGVSLTGPIALIIGGLSIAGIATYFAFSKTDNATLAQKFKEALIKQTEKAIETNWDISSKTSINSLWNGRI